MGRGRPKKVVEEKVEEKKNEGKASKEEAIAKGFSQDEARQTEAKMSIAESKEKSEEDLQKEEIKSVNKQFKDFDKVNSQIQNQINSFLNKEGINVEFLDDSKTVLDYIDTGNYASNFSISGDVDAGWPVGRISEIAGDPSTGKTLVSTIAAVQALIKGYMVYYIDSEQAYDVNFAKLIARRMKQPESIVSRINYIQIDKVEELTATVVKIIDVFEKNKVDTGALIVLDSVAFLSTNKEETDVMAGEDKNDFTKAKKLRQFVRVAKNKIKNQKICMIMTNQLTTDVMKMYGDKKVTTGGTAVPFASSVRVTLYSKKMMDKNNKKKFEGLLIRMKTTKSRLTTSYKEAEMPIYFDGRFSRYIGLVQTLVDQEIIKKKTDKIFYFADVEFTKRSFVDIVCNNPENWKKLKQAIKDSATNKDPSIEDDDENIITEDMKEEDI